MDINDDIRKTTVLYLKKVNPLIFLVNLTKNGHLSANYGLSIGLSTFSS